MLKYFLVLLLIPFHLCAQYELSVCAIFQNEGPYLKEWIEFHKLQGVQHFYLYNNSSNDAFRKILQPYVDTKEVSLIQWLHGYDDTDTTTWSLVQTGAYMDCIKKYGWKSTWIAFIDVDEFLFCPSGAKLNDFLKGYIDHAAVCVNWLMFGTSYVEDFPENYLLIEMLTRCAKHKAAVNKHIKSIVQPAKVASCPSPHYFLYKEEAYAVAPNHSRVDGPFSSVINHDSIRINHYWTRTEKYLRECKIPSRIKRRSFETEEGIRKEASTYNVTFDTAILNCVPQLRARMGYE